MRRRTLLILLAVCAALAPAALGAVSAKDLATADVVLDTGVERPATTVARLQTAADELAAKGFPTKFVLIATPAADMDRVARLLRTELRRTLGPDAVDAVLVLAPRSLGINAKVLDCERRLAFESEVATLRRDDIQGTINVARRLQDYDAQQKLRDSDCNEIDGQPTATADDGGPPWLLIGILIGAGVLVGVAAVLARRAARSRTTTDASVDDGADDETRP